MQLAPWRILRPATCTHDQIDARQLMLMQPERFADHPADPVALHTTACDTNRNSETQTRASLVIQECGHAKESITKPPPVCVGCIEIRLAT